MAAVQETEDLGKAPATFAIAPWPAPGTGARTLLDRLREALRARLQHTGIQRFVTPDEGSPEASYTGRSKESRILCGYV